jgi:predicted nucleotidyltransferase
MTVSDSSGPTPYADLNKVLLELVTSIKTILGEHLMGVYLQGSFAIGDFDLHSDVDFIVAIQEQLAAGQVERLQAMHQRIYDLAIPWAQHLEGSYFPREMLRRYRPDGEMLWYLDNGARSLIQSSHCDTRVVRWTVRERGVVLEGPPPEALVDPIPVMELRREILATINDWGNEILAEPDRFDNRFYQGYIVLNYCRMLHDLQQGDLGSKRAGADWAKTHLDPSWSGLIDRAWSGRPDPARSVREPADPAEFKASLAFLSYAMDMSAQIAAEVGLNE